MTIQAFPALTFAPDSAAFSLVPNSQSFESPLNRTTQTVELPGARWSATVTWSLNQANVRAIRAFIASLRGMSGRFYFWDVGHESPAGTALGTPLVKGAGQTGRSIITDGWNINQAGLLLPGDYIGVGGELKMVTALAASNGSGQSTITFEPPLRSSPADNSAIVTVKPTCVMRLKDDEQDKFTFTPPRRTPFTLDCVEVF